MTEEWRIVLIVALAFNAAAGLAYRVYRYSKGGPVTDVWGQAVLGIVLVALAAAIGAGVGWARWIALGYGVLFAAVVMPVWTLAVLIPLGPRALDVSFAATYWVALGIIVVAAIAA